MKQTLFLVTTLLLLAAQAGWSQEPATTPASESGQPSEAKAVEKPTAAAAVDTAVATQPAATPSPLIVIEPKADDPRAAGFRAILESLQQRHIVQIDKPSDMGASLRAEANVRLGFVKDTPDEKITNLLVDLWQAHIPGLRVDVFHWGGFDYGNHANIPNSTTLTRQQVVELWKFFDKQKFEASFTAENLAYKKPVLPTPELKSEYTELVKVERGLAVDAAPAIETELLKKGLLLSLGADAESNSILVDRRDGVADEVRLWLPKWQNYYHPPRSTKVFTNDNAADLALLLKHLNPHPSFGAFANPKEKRLVVRGKPEHVQAAEATVNRLHEIVKQVVVLDEKIGPLLKTLGTEHPDVVKLDQQIADLEGEIVKLEASGPPTEDDPNFKKFVPTSRIKEFKTPPEPSPSPESADPKTDDKTLELKLVLQRITPAEAAQLLKLVISDDTFTAIPDAVDSHMLRVTGTKAHLAVVDSVLTPIERPNTAAPSIAPPAEKPAEAAVAPAAPKAIILILDPYAKQSEVVQQVVEALEQAGIAKTASKEYTPAAPSKFRVTLTLNKDEPFPHVQQLIQAIKDTGLEQLAFRMEEGGPNVVSLEVPPDGSSEDWHRVENALRAFEKDSPLKFQISISARGGQGPSVGGYVKEESRGGGVSDGALGIPASAIPGRNWVSSGTEIIAIADDGKSVAAYCEQHPTWVSVQLDPSIDAEPEHVFRGLIGAVQHGRQCHAYSTSQHKWATLTLPAGEEAVPEIGGHFSGVSVHSKTQGDYVFKDQWGKWFSGEEIKAGKVAEHLAAMEVQGGQAADKPSKLRNDEIAQSVVVAFKQVGLRGRQVTIEINHGVCVLTGQMIDGESVALAGKIASIIQGVESVDNQLEVIGKDTLRLFKGENTIKTFSLKYTDANQSFEVLQQVYNKGPAKFVVDARTNSVIVSGPNDQVQEIEALLRKLDEPGKATPEVNFVPINPEAAQLIVQLEDERTTLLQTVGPQHPKVLELQARLAAARRAAPSITAKEVIPFLNDVYSELQRERDELARQLGQDHPRVADFSALVAEYPSEIRELENCDDPQLFRNTALMLSSRGEAWLMIPHYVEKLRAEREQLLKQAGAIDPKTNEDPLSQLDLKLAYATVHHRDHEKAPTAQTTHPHTEGLLNPRDERKVLSAEEQKCRAELDAAAAQYDRAQRLRLKGVVAEGEVSEALVKRTVAEANLVSVRVRIEAARERLQADVLRVMEDPLTDLQTLTGADHPLVRGSEAKLKAILDKVDQTPEEAEREAHELAGQYVAEEVKTLEAEIAWFQAAAKAGEIPQSHPKLQQLQARLAVAQRQQRALKLLPGMPSAEVEKHKELDARLATARGIPSNPLDAPPTAFDSTAPLYRAVLREVRIEREALAKKLGEGHVRVVALKTYEAAVEAQVQADEAAARAEGAKSISELKEALAMMTPEWLATIRAKRDLLVQSDPENPQIDELTQGLASAIVMLRSYQRIVDAFESGQEYPMEAVIRIQAQSLYAPAASPQNIPHLRQDYEAAEAEAHRLAEQLRQPGSTASRDVLRQAVARAFAARQSLLRAELLEMQTKLAQTQQSIELRERITDQIIQRRVEDLLNPQLEWEGTHGGQPVTIHTDSAKNEWAVLGLGLKFQSTEKTPQPGFPLQGAFIVTELRPDGPAALSGCVQEGDNLDALGSVKITSQKALDDVLRDFTSFPLTFVVNRKGELIAGEFRVDQRTPGASNEVKWLLGIRFAPEPVAIKLSQEQPYKRGMLIEEIYKDFPAEKTGLQAGDLLVRLGGMNTPELTSHQQIVSFIQLYGHNPLKFIVVRDGKPLTGEIQARKLPGASSPHPQSFLGGWIGRLLDTRPARFTRHDLGATLRSVTEEAATIRGSRFMGGLSVEEVMPGLPIEKAGIVVGDVLVSLNGQGVLDEEDLARIFNGEGSKPMHFETVRGPFQVGQDNSRTGMIQGFTPPSSSPNPELLDKLQGTWDVVSMTDGANTTLSESTPNPDGIRVEVTVVGNLLKVYEAARGHRIEAFSALLKLGEAGPPQQLDLTFNPNDGAGRFEHEGIIEIIGETAQLCFAPQAAKARPEVFIAGKQVQLWVLRRKAVASGTRKVLVALQDIHPGDRLTEENVTLKDIPTAALAIFGDDFIVSKEDYEDRSLTVSAVKGDPIHQSRLSDKGVFGASSQIPIGMRIFTFAVSETTSHSGLLRPGDKVDVTVAFVNRTGTTECKLLLENVTIFACESRTALNPDGKNEQRPRNVSLLLTPEQDGYAKIAQSRGQLSLALRHPDDDEVVNAGGVNMEVLDELKHAVAPENAPESEPVKGTSAVTELEGDWHLVAVTHYEGKTRPATNLTIRGDRFITEAIESEMAWSFTRDSNSKTIQWTRLLGETRKPPLVGGNIGASYRHGTYDLQGDLLTIHEAGFNSTFLWKRGHRDLPTKPGVPEGMAVFSIMGDEAATGEGKLMPGDYVDVSASFSQGENTPQTRVVVERVEVDSSVEHLDNRRKRYVNLLVTKEQADLLEQTSQRGKLKLVARQPGDDTLQYPGGINPQVLVEMQAAAGADPESPLAGDWHLYSQEVDGNITGERINLSIHGDVWSRPGRSRPANGEGNLNYCRIWVNKDQRAYVVTDWPEPDGSSYGEESGTYEIDGESLILRPSGEQKIVQVWKKGHRKLIGPLAPASDAQKLRWRSGIVEILSYRQPRRAAEKFEAEEIVRPDSIGHGVIVSSEGLILSQLGGHGISETSTLSAQFDDGSEVALAVIEETSNGWFALQPKTKVQLNHFFPLSTTPTAVADEVYAWGRTPGVEGAGQIRVDNSRVMLLDRQIANMGTPAWQLSKPDNFGLSGTFPVLSGDGELLGITLERTGDLLLALPASRLTEMFPKAFPVPTATPVEPPQAEKTGP